ncbi:DNA mismatch endonuclease Vsr [Agrobacterium tumefaciens]|uniref:very short patch repair endonuclease n=2 Tax=Agrobacterium tumefaciens TaxID=358 RepID=UPI001573B884|nr:very short patch repair endonuclease [Agrobacterium tumefaciens]NSZ00646.1 DNA mismatch endonuclease Vsr [Agrobacterium tumefaciens]NSZ38140.1 DNA mismatch endonuclease Vsr [Agrobacterium tumefaciens]NTB25613.1 DNA mismatch endonuclease Vsr [Agrobacterium tumefaciens]NTB27044.1 DNA mismatch endonuclease Vsr [Agrobacterium tumefaciens]NTB32330.1 DNA mismatch endonuclease Vsr [Agrobacterium tumefaciens]
MADIVSAEVRSRMMSGIRAKDTRPEMIVRRGLHAAGFRYRLHAKGLPGSPDLVLPRYRAVVFVHGCFWHGHDCHLFRLPSTRTSFWEDKISRNIERDVKALQTLRDDRWRTAIVWECSLRGRTRKGEARVLHDLVHWIQSGAGAVEIRGDIQ